MKKFILTIDNLAEKLGKIGSYLIFGIALLIFVEIVLRSFLNKTLYVTAEYSGYTMCVITYIGIAYALREKAHIRITILYSKFSERNKVIIDMFNYFIGIVLCLYVFRASANFFWSSVVNKTQSIQAFATYLFIPRFFVPFGIAMMMLQYLCEFLKSFQIFKELKGK